MNRYWKVSTWLSYRPFYSLTQRHGWCTPTLGGYWGGYTIDRNNGFQGSNFSKKVMGDGINPSGRGHEDGGPRGDGDLYTQASE